MESSLKVGAQQKVPVGGPKAAKKSGRFSFDMKFAFIDRFYPSGFLELHKGDYVVCSDLAGNRDPLKDIVVTWSVGR